MQLFLKQQKDKKKKKSGRMKGSLFSLSRKLHSICISGKLTVVCSGYLTFIFSLDLCGMLFVECPELEGCGKGSLNPVPGPAQKNPKNHTMCYVPGTS